METAGLRLGDALNALAHELVARTGADACVLSRALGDALIVVARTVSDDAMLGLGQGFLVSDYPATARVLATGEPVALTLEDADVDPNEATLLRELGFATLMMLPLAVAGEAWGLVELYREDVRPFSAADVEVARAAARIG